MRGPDLPSAESAILGSFPGLLAETVDNVSHCECHNRETVTSIRGEPPGLRKEATVKVYLGIDWSEQKHQVCFMNKAGAVIQQMSVEHSVDGFLKLEAAQATISMTYLPLITVDGRSALPMSFGKKRPVG